MLNDLCSNKPWYCQPWYGLQEQYLFFVNHLVYNTGAALPIHQLTEWLLYAQFPRAEHSEKRCTFPKTGTVMRQFRGIWSTFCESNKDYANLRSSKNMASQSPDFWCRVAEMCAKHIKLRRPAPPVVYRLISDFHVFILAEVLRWFGSILCEPIHAGLWYGQTVGWPSYPPRDGGITRN